jgi:hypothetical protein
MTLLTTSVLSISRLLVINDRIVPKIFGVVDGFHSVADMYFVAVRAKKHMRR